jgi:hypothetical protein
MPFGKTDEAGEQDLFHIGERSIAARLQALRALHEDPLPAMETWIFLAAI